MGQHVFLGDSIFAVWLCDSTWDFRLIYATQKHAHLYIHLWKITSARAAGSLCVFMYMCTCVFGSLNPVSARAPYPLVFHSMKQSKPRRPSIKEQILIKRARARARSLSQLVLNPCRGSAVLCGLAASRQGANELFHLIIGARIIF